MHDITVRNGDLSLSDFLWVLARYDQVSGTEKQ